MAAVVTFPSADSFGELLGEPLGDSLGGLQRSTQPETPPAAAPAESKTSTAQSDKNESKNEAPHDHAVHCRVCSHPLAATGEWSTTCERCGSVDTTHRPRSPRVTLAFALTAFILYVPSMLFPFMTIDMYGNRNSSTIWGGIQSLAESGSIGIALIVFVASVFLPALKLVVLIYLGLTAKNGSHQRFKTKLFHFIEAIGRWSMLDIFLLAVLVAILKLGHWTSVSAEPGAGLFALVVIFTMLSSAAFDPKLLWSSHEK